MSLGTMNDLSHKDRSELSVSDTDVLEGMTYRDFSKEHMISISRKPGIIARSNQIIRDQLGILEQPLLRFIYGSERLEILDKQLSVEHRKTVARIRILLSNE